MNYEEAKKYLYNGDINIKIPERELRSLYMAVTDDKIQDGLQLIKTLTSCDDNTAKLLWVDLKCDYGNKENNPILQAREEYEREQECAFVPMCPTCSSANIQKIGGMERVGSVAMLGLFSNKINKSFKCKSCGYTW